MERQLCISKFNNILNDTVLSEKIENSVYDYTINQVKIKGIEQDITNKYFKRIYVNKIITLFNNLDKNSYITNTNFVPYNFTSLTEFINKMSPYWIQILEQFIPATTLWSGGNLIENNIFNRSKYTYLKPRYGVDAVNRDADNYQCGELTPVTPTPTPTITSTPKATPTVTPTHTVTPSVTPTMTSSAANVINSYVKVKYVNDYVNPFGLILMSDYAVSTANGCRLYYNQEIPG